MLKDFFALFGSFLGITVMDNLSKALFSAHFLRNLSYAGSLPEDFYSIVAPYFKCNVGNVSFTAPSLVTCPRYSMWCSKNLLGKTTEVIS